MRKMINDPNSLYTLDEIMNYSKSVQKKVISSLSNGNRYALIDECLNRYYSALNDRDNFSFSRINKYANFYTLLFNLKDAA